MKNQIPRKNDSAPIDDRSSALPAASVVLAAGKGSRMTGYDGCKALLPLLPGKNPFEGRCPILIHILESLPSGPAALVVHHRKDQVIEQTAGLSLTYCEQPVLNGTGGGLLAARRFLQQNAAAGILITMGDVPLVTRETYSRLIQAIEDVHMAVLAFAPADKKRYGLLEVDGHSVKRIVEWEYWHRYTANQKENLYLCNSGIYAVRGATLLDYLPVIESRPHRVTKHLEGVDTLVEEYFITDLVEYLNRDGREVGYLLAAEEQEVMGVDDPEALEKVQRLYAERCGTPD
ncbi:MAG TPA: MobA-like NTP transferase domain containing protein [Desulfobacteraceae bacterium]|nr:MobA-like NTP transferase domain containing protein [Desulfobacteraceae bacterium]